MGQNDIGLHKEKVRARKNVKEKKRQSVRYAKWKRHGMVNGREKSRIGERERKRERERETDRQTETRLPAVALLTAA